MLFKAMCVSGPHWPLQSHTLPFSPDNKQNPNRTLKLSNSPNIFCPNYSRMFFPSMLT